MLFLINKPHINNNMTRFNADVIILFPINKPHIPVC